LKRWLEDERDFLVWRGEVGAQREEYNKAAREGARQQRQALLMGLPLDTAKKWLAARRGDIESADEAFIKASAQAERAVARNRQLLQAAVGVLMLGTIAGLLGVIYKDEIKNAWFEHFTVGPYIAANFTPYLLTQEAERALKPLASFHECLKDCPEMIVVPAGSFMMGSPESETGRRAREGPQHEVTIAKFAVSKFEVTWDEWGACVKYRGCPHISDSAWGYGKRPVINVKWEQVYQYVAWLSRMTGQPYRLLTEAEWEYAARAGTKTAYPWGNEIGNGNANCSGCGSQWADDEKTAPVGSFPANAFGLHDMNGNVWEWVEDCYQSNYDGAPTDGSALIRDDCINHVVRGGSWAVWQGESARSASRDNYARNQERAYVGFRIARTLAP
jgi:formylglycine-generating enzyme required for sulfatase activity